MRHKGYTLAEVVVAVTLLAVGVLGIASTMVPVARLIRWGGAQAAAAALAGSQLDALRSGGCARLAPGDSLFGGRYRLRWDVGPAGPLRRITAVVTYAWDDALHSDTFETALACAR